LSKKKPTYTELQARLEQAEATLDALRRGEIDSLLGEAGPLLVQYKSVVDELTRLRAEAEELAQQWQTTFDATGDAIWILDAEQRVVRANKAAEAVFGCPLAEMPGRRCFDIIHHTDAPIPGCPFCAMCTSGRRESFEMQLEQRWYLVTVDPLRDAEGRLIGAVHIARDITAYRQAEEQIRFQADLVANISDAIIATDLEYNILSWNTAAEAIYGWKAEEVLGQPLGKFLRTQFVGDTREGSIRAVTEKGFWRGEVVQSRKDGTTVPILASVTLLRDREGNPQGLVAVNRDISERKEAERKIRESEETYRNLFQNAQVGLFRTRISDGKILESNEQLARMFGYDSREAFIAEYVTSQNYVDPGTRERMLRELREHGEVRNFQARFYRRDGSIFWAQYSAKIYPDKGWIEGVAEDITARKEAEEQLRAAHAELQRLLDEAEQGRRALLSVVEDQKRTEQALRESEARFRRLAENAQDLIYRYEFVPQRGFTYVSPAATPITGYTPEEHYADPDLGRKLVHPDDRPLLEAYFQGGGRFHEPIVLRWMRKDGRIIWTEQRNVPIYDAAGNLIAIEGIARDITERKQQEAELQRLFIEAEQARRNLLNVVEDQKRTAEALRESNRRLSALNRLGLALSQTLDLPTIYRTAYEHIAQLVDCPCFGISRYDPATQTLRAEYMLEEGEVLDVTRFPPLTLQSDAPLKGRARAILTQQPEIVADMPAPPSGQVLLVGKSDEAHITRSALYVPIVVQGQTTGLLEVQSYRENAYGEPDAALLGPVANQIGLVIENARLFATLAAERTLLRTLVNHLPDAIYVKDLATRKTLANPADVRNTGAASEADVLGKTDFELFPRELAEAYYADDLYVLQTGQPILNREERITRPDGVLGWQATSKVPLRDEEGRVIGLIGIGHDITAHKQAEEAIRTLNEELEARIAQRTAELARTSERLELATRAAGIGIWDWNIHEDRLTWDETTQRLLDVPQEASTGNYAAFLARLHPEDMERVNRTIQDVLRGATEYADEWRILKADGTVGYLQAAASITYTQGRAVRMIGVVWDITARKQVEMELRMFNELMVGRETRIIELKEEINRLAIESGRPAPYPPVWETPEASPDDLAADVEIGD